MQKPWLTEVSQHYNSWLDINSTGPPAGRFLVHHTLCEPDNILRVALGISAIKHRGGQLQDHREHPSSFFSTTWWWTVWAWEPRFNCITQLFCAPAGYSRSLPSTWLSYLQSIDNSSTYPIWKIRFLYAEHLKQCLEHRKCYTNALYPYIGYYEFWER